LEFLQYLPQVFMGWNGIVLVAGTVVGLLLGATPGLSPTMAVALLIPFTFHMDATSALILLGSLYTATVAGGAVSAILINIPGAPANIATVLDGHPMAKQGRATEALHYCFISSGVGGVLGVGVLIFFTPLLMNFVLRFGPAELFWVAILGVTVIGSMGGSSVLKGLIAGAFGIWISLIGYSPILGTERFVFSEHLAGGISIVPALIGLFAIPQILTLMETSKRGGNKGKEFAMETRGVMQSLRYNLGRLRALSIGSLIGIFVGVIPGAGGQVAGLMAYDQNKKLSRDQANYGKGEPDGVISAESANNAMVGASLIPLLSLGIPGSPTAAVLLGGLLIQGLFPGPNLFAQHAPVAWTFIGSLLVGQVLMMIFGLYISRYSRFVTRIPQHFMTAAVTVLAVFGAYSVQNSFSDVLVMMVLGTAMYFGMRLGFSPGPVVLGIILGPIAEDNYLQGKMIAEGGDGVLPYFFTGTINMVLIGLCLLSIGYSVYGEWRSMARRRRAAKTTGEMRTA
jgi:putative tricarboxylic transport membrane protein